MAGALAMTGGRLPVTGRGAMSGDRYPVRDVGRYIRLEAPIKKWC